VRFIYCYRWKATGQALYVGSAFDPAKRDRAHTKSKEIPFDRFISKHGRENFILEILEAFRANSIAEIYQLSVTRENHQMDVQKTWHEFGGQNFLRAVVVFDSDQKRQALTAALSAAGLGRKPTAETRAKMSKASKGRTPWNKGRKTNATTREKQKQSALKRSPESHKAHALFMCGKQYHLGHKASENTRARMQTSHIGKKPTDATRAKLRAAAIKQWQENPPF
jgi:group I intron endonuclease